MSAQTRVREHKWIVLQKPFNYDVDDFDFDTKVCACNVCDMLRHEGHGRSIT